MGVRFLPQSQKAYFSLLIQLSSSDTLSLFAAGLGALGLLGWRKKKKLATAK
jgi:hypothetical protein